MTIDDNVKVFGLANGMEIIAAVDSETPETFVLKQALAIHIQPEKPGPNGEPTVGLIPPTFFAGGEPHKGVDLVLYKSNILFTYAMREDLHKHYCAKTSKIVIASGNILTN